MRTVLLLGIAHGVAATVGLAVALINFFFGRYEPEPGYQIDDKGRY